MPTGGLTLLAREARASNARARAATAELASWLLPWASPGLMAVLARGPRSGRVHLLPDDTDEDEDIEDLAPDVPAPTVGRDLTLYVFCNAEGEEVRATRRDFAARYGINPGSMTDLLRGYVKSAKGWWLAGRVAAKRTNG